MDRAEATEPRATSTTPRQLAGRRGELASTFINPMTAAAVQGRSYTPLNLRCLITRWLHEK